MPQPDSPSGGVGYALPAVLLVAGAVVAVMAFADWRDKTSVERSALGFDGVVSWLSRGGVEARSFHGGDLLTRERVGLRVYPLYDIDLGQKARDPTTPGERLLRTGERDVALPVLRSKIQWLPTLVVLPKWRGGVIDLGVAHQDLLIPEVDVARILSQVAPRAGALLPRPQGFTSVATGTGDAAQLYDAQLIRAGTCLPVIGTEDAMLLGRCKREVGGFWLLTDPDLLDNHGLTRGSNARIAAELLPKIAESRPIVVDLTTTDAFDRALKVERRREWSDLLRFFEPPFTAAWAALAFLFALVLWRAWIRPGPIEDPRDDGLRAAREVSIDAKARLLRLSGHDAALIRAYIADRVQHLAAELFGPHRARGEDPFEQVRRLLVSRAPALAEPFIKAFRRDAGLPATDAELLRRLDDFEETYERILHEFGRTAEPRAGHP